MSTEAVLATLEAITGEGTVSGLTLRGNELGFILTLPPERKPELSALEARCRAALVPFSFTKVHIIQTIHDSTPIPPRQKGPYPAPRERAQWNQTPIAGVQKIIAIASGKGGVGKSTTTLGIAHALVASECNVSVLDADIYGPSLPLMLGLSNQGQPTVSEGKMQPYEAHGMAVMSCGFLMGDSAAILRGPMISKALQQLLRFTNWGERDVLLVDMPPGTGDVTISLCQQAPLSGVIIVTTPQEVATLDAHKCALAFKQLGIPLLGVVENMSYLELPDSSRHALFGSGGGARLAEKLGIPLLAQVPLLPEITTATDTGNAFVHAAYQTIARPIHEELD